MVQARTFLDHNSTAPLRPEVRVAVLAAMTCGNPSSVHREGRLARAGVERARDQVAALVGGAPEGVVFTGSGSEANAAVLRPGALLTASGRPVVHLLVGAAEHVSVLRGHGFPADSVDVVGVDAAGRVDLRHLSGLLSARPERATAVSVQVANGETGVVQPLAEVAALARSRDAAWHADAVQAAGRLPLRLDDLGADALTLSAHKLGGPMGVGALVFRPGRIGPAAAFVRGGGQERGLRSGTENVPGIVGFGVAALVAGSDVDREAGRLERLRDRAEAAVLRLAPGAVVFGEGAPRLANTLAFAVPGLRAETALMALDLDGVAVSSGSACSSGKVGRSHVLAAMGVPASLAAGAIRVSFGWDSSEEDVNRFADAFETMLQRLYEQGWARAA